ncbi:menaquinone-specific isochorismate synthase [Roseimicrobium gellanilyticum]|uniref:Menaquinone-specific isochorismate synthase n=1 Tax=Roseimicrobium gellanilyticum TaxID=748857 RepID=A0A366HQQ3_9BACT|nr:chorismate-binding protein [Roseimicrobium gellanilyticum]RBP45253.1 menaquinone-specific isochorismate synthase [Roseimicrobium gellanilyticum]
MMDLALFRLPDGRAWVGEGPFAEAAAPPGGTAFYVNDFTLSDARPWKIPARLTPVKSREDLWAALAQNEALNDAAAPKVRWQKPATEWFKMAFRRIRKDVLAHKLRKLVPVLTEEGELQSGDPRVLLCRVLEAPDGLWGYARVQGNQGFLGATPELLMQIEGSTLRTMALAGTAKPNREESFAADVKEIEEHELVAGFIEEALKEFGQVSRGAREVSHPAGLTHFRTDISVQLQNSADINDLIARLHPTPAVGCLPRDESGREKLAEYRRQLKTPAFFGAPFGLKVDDAFHCVVSIRGLAWNEATMFLPSGCGIVGGSAFDHEWRELRLKRESVAKLFGV